MGLTRAEEKNRLVVFRKRCDLAPFLGDVSWPDGINYGAAVPRSETNILLWGKIKKTTEGDVCGCLFCFC